ncbi:MAG: hypothetical protein HYS14_05795 [Candidatus Rokubacteria bacterium]|nr:hypothetical protein [Candidatus Rokubacteria bacterium]
MESAEHTGSHMHDFEAHVRAVEEDLEYYRTKRLEPRVFTLLRRGVLAFSDLLEAASSMAADRQSARGPGGQQTDLEARVRAVEDGLEPGDKENNIILACQAKSTGNVMVEA